MIVPTNPAIDDAVREIGTEARHVRAAEERASRRTMAWVYGASGVVIAVMLALSLIDWVEGPNKEPAWFRLGMTVCQYTLFAGFAGGALFGATERHLALRPRARAAVASSLTALIVAGFSLLLVLPTARVLYTLAAWIARAPPVLAGSTVLALGVALFGLRYTRRAVYGLLEVVVGIVVGTSKMAAVYTLPALHADWKTVDLALGVLCAGVYLVVRGLDNVYLGCTNEPRDPWAVFMMGKLARYSLPKTSADGDQEPPNRISSEYLPQS